MPRFLAELRKASESSSSLYSRPKKESANAQELAQARGEIERLEKTVDFLLERCQEAGIIIKKSLLDGFSSSPAYLSIPSPPAEDIAILVDEIKEEGIGSAGNSSDSDGMEWLKFEADRENLFDQHLTPFNSRSVSPMPFTPHPTPTEMNFNFTFPLLSTDSFPAYFNTNMLNPLEFKIDPLRHVERYDEAMAELNRFER